ncbi:hypothetical protein Rsub_10438 [Raphidocelis subcapitata]|uniref:CRAL-TRIO domain-containing protein n=1 Tax=Raphidocelis subcapitata TaxID=307507 RepID=A0A2V0PKF4_9CHLO|nr:hypothetical protein Rsub_10438 [Raphidocelis subcapitata]|eukprot:GBF97515.1 hypothetical protein Rsub_10438 [Raphidocelis subcapitata]
MATWGSWIGIQSSGARGSSSGSAGAMKGATKDAQSDARKAQLVAAARAELGGSAAAVDHLLRTGGEEGLTDGQLARWLAARGWDPARAARDLAAHAEWRAAYCPRGRVLDCEIAGQLNQQKVFIQGLDRCGRAVVILAVANHIPSPDQSEVERLFCYTADAAIALADGDLNPGGLVSFVMDVEGFGLRNYDLKATKTLFQMIRQHYVERLSKLYIHKASPLLIQLFRLVSPFIDATTRGKIVFLPHDPTECAEVLGRDMDVMMLPPNFGGASEPRPVEAAWAEIEARRGAASGLARAASDSSSGSGADAVVAIAAEAGGGKDTDAAEA